MSFSFLKYLLLTMAVLLTGCMKEDYSDCEDDEAHNFTLLFTFPDENGRERFSERIEGVLVYLFDEGQNYVTSAYADRAHLTEFCGVTFRLDPGVYHAVCWGNVHNASQVSAVTTMGSSYVMYGESIFESPVYYAPNRDYTRTRGLTSDGLFRVLIPDRGDVTETIEFMESSRPVTVTVIGFNDVVDQVNMTPDLEFTNFPQGHCFEMSLHENKGSYRKNASRLPEIDKSRAVFHTPYFRVEDDVEIILSRASNGNMVYTGNLRYILDEVGFDPEPDEPIEIEIEFMEGFIKITVAGYREGPIIPNI